LRSESAIFWLLSLALSGAPALGGEAFPGQADLAAGLACLSSLDAEGARSHLERALARFSPEADPEYIAHVVEARRHLATLAVARDDLTEAEAQFAAILAVDSGFALDDADPPPKVRYVFEQARQKRERLKARASRPPVARAPEPSPPPAAAVEPPPAQAAPAPTPPRSDIRGAPPAGTESAVEIRAGAGGGGIFLFGRDAESLSAGAGAGLALSFGWARKWNLGLLLAWGRHASDSGAGTLQHLSAAATGALTPDAGPLELRLGLGAGALAAGTRDRYDHWGALFFCDLGLRWPAREFLALVLSLRPSAWLTPSDTSFFLSLQGGLEFSWPMR